MGKGTHYPDTGRRAPIGATVGGIAALTIVLLAAGCGRDARNDVRPTPPAPAPAAQREWPQVTPDDPASANAC